MPRRSRKRKVATPTKDKQVASDAANVADRRSSLRSALFEMGAVPRVYISTKKRKNTINGDNTLDETIKSPGKDVTEAALLDIEAAVSSEEDDNNHDESAANTHVNEEPFNQDNVDEGPTEQPAEEPVVPSESTAPPPPPKTRKGRGRTLCQALVKDKKQRLLEWDDKQKVVGEHAQRLSSLCGQMVRSHNMAPLQIKGWHQMPEEKIRSMMNRISDYFIVYTTETPADVCALRRKYLIQKLNALYREYRSELYCIYKERHTHPGKVRKVLQDTVSKEDWEYLVAYWNSEQFQGMSTRNAQNREKLNMIACTGRRSFSEVEHNLTSKHGRKPTRLEMFIETRKRADGKLVDDAAQKKLAEVEEIRKQCEDEDLEIDDEAIFDKVFGGLKTNKGPCRQIGALSRDEASSSKLKDLEDKLEEALRRAENSEKKSMELEEKSKELEATSNELKEKYEAMFKLMQDKFGST